MKVLRELGMYGLVAMLIWAGGNLWWNNIKRERQATADRAEKSRQAAADLKQWQDARIKVYAAEKARQAAERQRKPARGDQKAVWNGIKEPSVRSAPAVARSLRSPALPTKEVTKKPAVTGKGQHGARRPYHGPYRYWGPTDIPPRPEAGLGAGTSEPTSPAATEWDHGFGQIKIDHNDGWQTLYSRMLDASPSTGQPASSKGEKK